MKAGSSDGWMFEQAPGVALHESRRQDAHEAGEQHQVGRVRVDRLGERGVEGLALGVRAVIDDRRRDAVRGGEREARGVGAGC